MQTALSRIWTWVARSIFNDNCNAITSCQRWQHYLLSNICLLCFGWKFSSVEPQLLNVSQVEQFRVWLRNFSRKCLGNWTNVWSSNTQVKPMKTCANVCHSKLNTIESTQAALLQFLKKLVVKHNFKTNYTWQPSFQRFCFLLWSIVSVHSMKSDTHCVCVFVYII